MSSSPSAVSAPLLAARGLVTGYPDSHDVIKGVDLTLNPGELVAVLGTNGCGKSTLLRALTGLLPLRGGEVLLDGRPLRAFSRSEQARRLAVVSQTNPPMFAFSVEEAVAMGRYPFMGAFGSPRAVDRARVDDALALADIAVLRERPLDELSGGEHQRVLLARALAQRARILLLDEPNTHLDLKHRVQIFRLLRRLCRDESLGVLCVLHDLNLAAEFCTRAVLLAEGRVIVDGAPETVFTSEHLRAAFDVEVPVVPNPFTGRPMIAWHREENSR